MNNIIEAVKPEAGYKVNNTKINILCYADYTVLLTDDEDKGFYINLKSQLSNKR